MSYVFVLFPASDSRTAKSGSKSSKVGGSNSLASRACRALGYATVGTSFDPSPRGAGLGAASTDCSYTCCPATSRRRAPTSKRRSSWRVDLPSRKKFPKRRSHGYATMLSSDRSGSMGACVRPRSPSFSKTSTPAKSWGLRASPRSKPSGTTSWIPTSTAAPRNARTIPSSRRSPNARFGWRDGRSSAFSSARPRSNDFPSCSWAPRASAKAISRSGPVPSWPRPTRLSSRRYAASGRSPDRKFPGGLSSRPTRGCTWPSSSGEVAPGERTRVSSASRTAGCSCWTSSPNSIATPARSFARSSTRERSGATACKGPYGGPPTSGSSRRLTPALAATSARIARTVAARPSRGRPIPRGCRGPCSIASP